MTTEQDDTGSFGARLYEALKREDGRRLVLGHLKYADVQALKVADRDVAARLLRAFGYEHVQRIREQSPDVAAAALARSAERQADAAGSL